MTMKQLQNSKYKAPRIKRSAAPKEGRCRSSDLRYSDDYVGGKILSALSSSKSKEFFVSDFIENTKYHNVGNESNIDNDEVVAFLSSNETVAFSISIPNYECQSSIPFIFSSDSIQTVLRNWNLGNTDLIQIRNISQSQFVEILSFLKISIDTISTSSTLSMLKLLFDEMNCKCVSGLNISVTGNSIQNYTVIMDVSKACNSSLENTVQLKPFKAATFSANANATEINFNEKKDLIFEIVKAIDKSFLDFQIFALEISEKGEKKIKKLLNEKIRNLNDNFAYQIFTDTFDLIRIIFQYNDKLSGTQNVIKESTSWHEFPNPSQNQTIELSYLLMEMHAFFNISIHESAFEFQSISAAIAANLNASTYLYSKSYESLDENIPIIRIPSMLQSTEEYADVLYDKKDFRRNISNSTN